MLVEYLTVEAERYQEAGDGYAEATLTASAKKTHLMPVGCHPSKWMNKSVVRANQNKEGEQLNVIPKWNIKSSITAKQDKEDDHQKVEQQMVDRPAQGVRQHARRGLVHRS